MTPIAYLTAVDTASPVVSFLTFAGTIRPVQQTFDRVVRRGVNGIGIIYTGQRGQAFSIKTSIDFATVGMAQSAFAQHRAFTGNRLDLYYRGTKLGAVLVTNVDQDSIDRTGRFVNGINVDGVVSAALLRETWTLEILN